MVARMNARYKNHSGFLRIAARVRKRVSDVEFLLVGDGPFRPELEKEAEALGLETSSCFSAIARIFRRARFDGRRGVDVGFGESFERDLGSDGGTFARVAYDVGGNRELVNEERGALVAPGDESGSPTQSSSLLSRPAPRRVRDETLEGSWRTISASSTFEIAIKSSMSRS